MSQRTEMALPDGATVWLRGILLRDPRPEQSEDVGETTSLTLQCDTGADSTVNVNCRVRGKLSRYCRLKQFAQGDPLWVLGTISKRDRLTDDATAMVTVLDLTGDTGATWSQEQP